MASRQQKAMRDWVALGDGRRIAPTGTLRILALDVEEGWGLEAGVMEPSRSEKDLARPWDRINHQYIPGVTTVRGAHAMPLLRRFLPRVNRSGATEVPVRDSVAMIETAGGPECFAAWAATQRQAWGGCRRVTDLARSPLPQPAPRVPAWHMRFRPADGHALLGAGGCPESRTTRWQSSPDLPTLGGKLVNPSRQGP
jgi:hypothetical protein